MQKLNTKTILILFLFAFVCRASFAQSTRTLSLNLEDKELPFGLTQKVPAGLPKIGLALSGGGARSFAQLGVLRALEEGDIPIDIIAGTSMGSIIGGLYSAGYSIAELDSIINDAPWDSFFSIEEADRNELFLDKKITEDKAIIAFRLDGLRPVIPTAVNTGQRVANFLNLLSINAPIHVKSDFDELLYNFRAVCTNFVTGEGKVLKGGLLSQAMRASSSVSLLLEPVKIDSLVLADGGLVSNVPVKAAKNSGADYIIAVNNTSPLHSEEELNYPWNIADQLVSIPIKNLNDVQLKEADFVIEPEIGPHSNTDFTINEILIENGYDSSINFIDSIKNDIERIYKNNLNGDEFFIKKLAAGENPSSLEKDIVRKYSNTDLVSSRDLYYDLYSIYSRGYYKNVYFELNENSSETVLKIVELEMPAVRKITLNGIIIIDFEKAKSLFDPLIGKPFNSKLVLRSLLELMRMYRMDGFSLAEIESVFFYELSQNLEINVSEGIISDIVVKGNDKTDVELITREFPLIGGEYFKYQNLREGLANLRATNLFENIELLLVKNYDENILEIKVDEKVSSLIRLGVRIDNENLTQVLADIRDENIFGTGTEVGAMLSGGIRNQSYALEHRVNRIFNTYITYALRAFYKSEEINVYQPDTSASKKQFYRNKVLQYTQSKFGGSFGIGTQIQKLGNIILEGKYQRSEIRDVPGFSGTLAADDLFSLKLELAIDSRNKYPYPTYGSSLITYYETAQTILSGDLGYSKLYLDYKSIFSLGASHTFNTGIKLGFADKTLPLSEFFSMGGQNNFFGLRNYEFRGRQIFVTSAEYQLKLPFKLFFDTYLLFRYDLGAVWAVQEEIKFKDLLHGIGTTISLDTPLGPADFSIGKSFTFVKDNSGSTPAWGETLFYFTIGYYY